MRIAVTIVSSVLLSSVGALPTNAGENERAASPQDIEFFEKKVRPVLAARCYSCHSGKAKKLQGGLKVDSFKALLSGGDSGAAIVPGKPAESLLIAAIQFDSDADFQMPPKGKLPDREIAALTEWVLRGAPFPGGTNSAPSQEDAIDFEEARQFWSFVPAEHQALPAIQQSDWPRQRIDHFILAAIEREGLSPSPI